MMQLNRFSSVRQSTTLSFRRALALKIALCVGVIGSLNAEPLNGNTAAFSLTATSQWDVPFPSDYFTVPDENMSTGVRVNLPLPSDPLLVSEREDIESVNKLDGFSVFPRITIPLSGAVPDASTFNSTNVFLVSLSGPEFGTVVPIDQRLVDDSIPDQPRLIFAPDVVLREGAHYALVVKRGLLGTDGEPYSRGTDFDGFLLRFLFGIEARSDYESILRAVVWWLNSTGIAPVSELSTISVFRTRTVADVPLKLLRRLDDADIPVAPPRFSLDEVNGLESFERQDILTINSYLHRGTEVSDGSTVVSFPPHTLRLPDDAIVLSTDLDNEIYVQNLSNGLRMLVPEELMDAGDGSIDPLDITELNPQAGDELAVLVRKERLTPERPVPYLWDSIGTIVFGAVDLPSYVDETGRIPTVSTKPEFVPTQTGTETVIFNLHLPTGTPPPQGWPVVHFLHGGAEHKGGFLDDGLRHNVAVLASLGIATVGFPAQEFGGGPNSFVEIETVSGVRTIEHIGRGLDLDSDGYFEKTELYSYPQRLADLGYLLRSIQLGVDLDTNGVPDLATTPNRTFVTGISYGGAAAFIAAAIETGATVFAPNVPATIGSRSRSGGYSPIIPLRARTYAAGILEAREPSLLNGPSPIHGGEFDENVPMKRQPVRVGGMVEGAESIQRAMDLQMWRDLQHIPLAYADAVETGALRRRPAKLLLQIVRGDGAANNPGQAMMILSSKIDDQTAIIRLDREPAYDEQYAERIDPDLARHLVLALPYSGIPQVDVAGGISHLSRLQVGEYLRTGGAYVPDPDGGGGVYAGDVFEFPVTVELLEEMLIDPGFPP